MVNGAVCVGGDCCVGLAASCTVKLVVLRSFIVNSNNSKKVIVSPNWNNDQMVFMLPKDSDLAKGVLYLDKAQVEQLMSDLESKLKYLN